MIRPIRSRMSFANVTSLVALFVALGGSSYAALNLPKGSVGSKQLKKNAVTSPKVKPGSLLLSDFSSSQRASLRGPAGLQGPAGQQGPQGPRGDVGAPGATNVVVRTGPAVTAGANGSGPGCVDGVPGGSKGYRDAANALVNGGCGGGAGGSATSTAQCAAGEVATGGGHTFETGKRHALVTESRPAPAGAGQTPTGWFIRLETLTNDASNDTPVAPYAICARP